MADRIAVMHEGVLQQLGTPGEIYNHPINEFVAGKLEIPKEKVLNNIQRLGNCSAAALPNLLAEASRSGRIKDGDLVSLTAFGSGFTWGSAILRWG